MPTNSVINTVAKLTIKNMAKVRISNAMCGRFVKEQTIAFAVASLLNIVDIYMIYICNN